MLPGVIVPLVVRSPGLSGRRAGARVRMLHVFHVAADRDGSELKHPRGYAVSMQPHFVQGSAVALHRSARRLIRRSRSLRMARAVRAMQHTLEQNAAGVTGTVDVRAESDSRVCVDANADGLSFTFVLRLGHAATQLSVVGRDKASSRVLRTVLVGRAPMRRGPGQRHVLSEWPAGARETGVEAAARMQWLIDLLHTVPHEGRSQRPIPAGYVLTLWWDLKPNFGDTVGPWLVQQLTGRPVINSNWLEPQRPALFTAGSVFRRLTIPGHRVWGTGVIGPFTDAELERLRPNRPEAIHAVRGALSRRELTEKLGWDVPEVYGDPALLLPRYLTPASCAKTSGKVAVVPHYAHRKLFSTVEGPRLRVVDATDGLERVVDQIANASHCISTSLHGVIVAHAYGVPWTWLRIGNQRLAGDTFKFEDFFTVLARSDVSEATVASADVAGLNFQKLANAARLPASLSDFSSLHDAFPAEGRWLHPTAC
jgi:hypothetical protein